MKKIFIILAILSMATLSFAAWQDSVTVNGDAVTLSKGVQADYQTYGGASNNTHYVAGTYNQRGTRAYGGSDEISTIKYTQCANDDCATAPTGIGSDSTTINSWDDVGD